MIDLTPLDVRKKRGDFRRILRGYDPEEVDTFMDLVADRFEELVRKNLHLSEKTESLQGQLESLVGREKAVQDALVSAQKLREDLRAQSQQDADTLKVQAEREAELLKAEAEAEIQRRLGEAEGLVQERQRALEELERSRLKFLKSFRGLLEREMDAVEVEESRRPLEETPLVLQLRGWMSSAEKEAHSELALEAEPDAAAEAESALEAELEAAPQAVSALEAEPDAAPEAESAFEAELEPEAESAPEEDTEPEVEPAPEADTTAVVSTEVAEVPPDLDAPVAAQEPTDIDTLLVEDTPAEAERGSQKPEEGPGGFDTQLLGGAIPVGIEDLAPTEAESELEPPGDDADQDTAAAEPESGHGESAEEPPAAGDQDLDESGVPGDPKWLLSLLKDDEEKE